MPRRIEICLGSSCFARGAARYPALMAAWLAARGVEAELSGHRCACACDRGPNLRIDGVEHRVPDEAALDRLLEAAFRGTADLT
jgi:NADH:ubiquinone oxidoreductase subunit E